MPKGILVFKLPEDSQDFKIAQSAQALCGAAQDFDNYLRNQLKYQELRSEERKVIEEIRKQFNEHFDGLLWYA